MKYQVARDKQNGSEPWLVLLHGLQSNRQIYSDFVQHPYFKERAKLTIDFVGFGESEKPRDFSYDLRTQAEMVAQITREEGVDKFVLICHSFGATVGTLMLEEYSDRILGLVSMEGNLTVEDSTHAHLIVDKSLDEATEFYAESRQKMKNDLENSGPLRFEWTKNTPNYVFHETAKSIMEYSKSGRLFEIFEKTPQKKLLLIGNRSSFASRPKADNIQTVEIEDAGHFMITDKPKETFEAVNSFLKAL